MVSVLIAGTFDLVHPGHIKFIQEADRLGDVTVVVGRDSTVMRVKGHQPVIPEDQRLEVVKNLKGVKKATLGYENKDPLEIVGDLKPDILLLGPNQNYSEKELKSDLEQRGLTTRIMRMTKIHDSFPFCSTTDIVKRILEVYGGGSLRKKPESTNK